jgi:hypothetical protein
VRNTKQALVVLVVGLTVASARGLVGASSGVAARAPAVVVPSPASVAAFPDLVEPRSNPVPRAPLRNVTDAHPYGEDPSGATPSEARLETAIDASNPYVFQGSVAAFPIRTLPDVTASRALDFENPYGAGLAVVEHAPIDSENPYVTGVR